MNASLLKSLVIIMLIFTILNLTRNINWIPLLIVWCFEFAVMFAKYQKRRESDAKSNDIR